MSTLATLVVKLVGETGDFQSAMSDAGSRASGLGGTLRGALTIGAGVAAAGIVALGGVLVDSVGEAVEAQNVQAQLGAVLESTGGKAGVTADMANNLATALSQTTRFGDETVLTGENMLLTFTNIGSEVFPMATSTMLDMSQALGQDVTQSAMQLGKALNDPVQGMTALKRVGVSFTDSQVEMVKQMVASGDVMGAQKLILNELATEFGGSATAAGATFAGQMDILKNNIGNVKEGIGTALLPILMTLASVLGPIVVAAFQGLADFITANVIPAIGTIVGWVQQGIGIFQGLAGAVDGTTLASSGFGALWQGLQPVIGAVLTALQTTFQSVFDIITLVIQTVATTIQARWTEISTATTGTWNAILAAVQTVVNAVSTVVQAVFGVIKTFLEQHGTDIMNTLITAWNTIMSIVQTVAQIIGTVVSAVFGAIASFLQSHGDQIQTILSAAWNLIKGVIETVLGVIKGIVEAVLQAIQGNWSGAWETVKATADRLWQGIKSLIENVLNLLLAFFGTNLEQVKAKFEAAWNAVKAKAEGIWNGIRDFLTNLWNGIKGTAETVWNGITTNITTPIQTLERSIEDTWNRIKQGAIDKWEALKKAVSDIVSGLISGITGMFSGLNIHIPMPHFNVSWNDIGFGVRLPSVSVAWYGAGGDFMANGPMLIGVGERGPEHVQITPWRKMGRDGGDGSGQAITINLNNPVVRETADLERLADLIGERLGVKANVNRRMNYGWAGS